MTVGLACAVKVLSVSDFRRSTCRLMLASSLAFLLPNFVPCTIRNNDEQHYATDAAFPFPVTFEEGSGSGACRSLPDSNKGDMLK
jgi:hypothetical protein